MSNETALASGSETTPSAGEVAYAAKPPNYFSGTRPDFVNELPNNPNARILEIGCGEGKMGHLVIAAGKCKSYHGVELFQDAADIARTHLTEVLQGDIEKMELPWPPESFDTLIMSEVLEHLTDPLAVLKKLHVLLKPGGMVLAGSPNVSYYKIIFMLLRGEWELADKGIMDRTHLRWFTPKSFRRMFEEAGYEVDRVVGLAHHGIKKKIASVFLLGQCEWLFAFQIKLIGHKK